MDKNLEIEVERLKHIRDSMIRLEKKETTTNSNLLNLSIQNNFYKQNKVIVFLTFFIGLGSISQFIELFNLNNYHQILIIILFLLIFIIAYLILVLEDKKITSNINNIRSKNHKSVSETSGIIFEYDKQIEKKLKNKIKYE
jgi:hypothetical protein